MSEHNDNSTIYICQWLLYLGVPFVRIDKEDKCFIQEINLSNEEVEIIIEKDKEIIRLSKIKSFWYRRGELNLYTPSLKFITDEKLRAEINHHLYREKSTLEHFFYHLLEKKPHIGTFDRRSVNKLKVLLEAANLGIAIPKTNILTNNKDINKKLKEPIITKSIYEGFRPDSIGGFICYTEKIKLEEIPDEFYISLFQEGIEKEADIRSFYLDGKFYSMAIRSQSNEQTQTDFRKYVKNIGNRCFPFKLPDSLESSLKELMFQIGLNTGSIDLILTKEGQLIFLEVNPVGQFGMTSVPCNYYLEKEIASKLISLMD